MLSMRRPLGCRRRVSPSSPKWLLWMVAAVWVLGSGTALADDSTGGSSGAAKTLRIGVLEFGTVRWTLDVVEHHGLLDASVQMKIVPLSSTNAVTVALQGGAVDIIVS